MPPASLVINEHDEDDPTADQELFLVLRGHAVFEIDGDRVDAPAGTLVFAPPAHQADGLRRRGRDDHHRSGGYAGKGVRGPRLGTVGSACPALPGR